MGNVVKFWDLSKPMMCRDFIAHFRVGPAQEKITHFRQANGEYSPIEEATDEQVVQLCQFIAETMEYQGQLS